MEFEVDAKMGRQFDLISEVQGVADGVNEARASVVSPGAQYTMLLMSRQLECIAKVLAQECGDCPVCTGKSKN